MKGSLFHLHTLIEFRCDFFVITLGIFIIFFPTLTAVLVVEERADVAHLMLIKP